MRRPFSINEEEDEDVDVPTSQSHPCLLLWGEIVQGSHNSAYQDNTFTYIYKYMTVLYVIYTVHVYNVSCH